MSPSNASGTRDTPFPSPQASPSSPGPQQPIRKAPSSPLAIISSLLSPPSNTKASQSKHSPSPSPNPRQSLESDLTSVRSEITSLHCSEFPTPPSTLPPIPASPQTPKSLYFSTSPITPRSRSPHSGFLPLQDPPRGSRRSLLGSPRSLKDFFSSSRSEDHSKFAAQQDQPPSSLVPNEPNTFNNLEDLKHICEESRESVSVPFSQYAVYKDSKQGSSPDTPTTAGVLTYQDWVCSSDIFLPLQPPRPAYVRDDVSALSYSQSTNDLSLATQLERTTQFGGCNQSPAPQSPRSVSPQPPRSPLPVPPTKRDSARESDCYSPITRKAGVTDIGIDISEEQLLSTDFITEMLKQPVTSSPHSVRFLPLCGSSRSPVCSDDLDRLSMDRNGEMRLVPQLNSTLGSPDLIPVSVFMSDASQYDTASSPQTPDPGRALPTRVDATDSRPSVFQLRNCFASPIFDTTPSLPISPLSPSHHSQSLAVPSLVSWGHGNPHPLVPSTPMSAGSFSDAASPRGSHGFAQANSRHISEWQKSSTSQSIASRLPIGPSSAAVGGSRDVSLRIGSPRVRQHHYPRHGLKPVMSLEQPPATSTLHNAPFASGSSSPPVDSYKKNQVFTGAVDIQPPVETKPNEHRPVKSNILSVVSHTSSTRTQHDSITPSLMLESRPVSSEDAEQSMQRRSFQSQAPSHHSYDSNFLSSDSSRDVEDSNSDVGEVQTASRVMDTTAPLMTKFGDAARPIVVGMATAVVVRSKSMDRRMAEQTGQYHPNLDANTLTSAFESETPTPPLLRHPPGRHSVEQSTHHQHLDACTLTSGFEPETSSPPSPRPAPSIDSPPSHRTDIPESAKSVYFSDDVHYTKHRTFLPYADEVAGQGFTFSDVTQNAPLDGEPSTVPKRRSSNNTGSVKSIVSYLTTKSKASTVTSKVTSHRSYQSTVTWAWWKKKPLPPLPPQSLPNNMGNVYDDQGEQQLPVHKERIGGSPPILQPGQYQRSKVDLVGQGEPQGWSESTNEKTPGLADGEHETFDRIDMFGIDSLKMAERKPSHRQDIPRKNEVFNHNPGDLSNTPDVQLFHRLFHRTLTSFLGICKTRKWLCFSLLGVVILVIIIGATLGTTSRQKHSNGFTGCSGNQTGVRCDLDATCTCPSLLSGTCAAPLAKALNSLVPVVSQLFVTNITSQALALVLWESQGMPTTQNCAFQADLVDVGSVLDGSLSPKRAQWAQAALLWNLFQTSDVDATLSLRREVESMPFGLLNSQDGIESDPSGRFSVSPSGYIYDFANQTITPPSLTFIVDGSPSSQQLSRVNSVAQGALDRMYSFASASSAQQQAALSRYWESVLTLHPNDLSTFLAAFKSSPIFLPFDVTASPGGQAISNLLTLAVNRTLSFPPAIGCYPGLSPSQNQRISAVETHAFGLSALNSTPSIFDSTCFASHPVYGILDVLRTRLPFSDSRSGVAKQAALVTSDAASRAVLHVGELLGALPAPTVANLTIFDVEPREFGTMSHLNHIALEWLRSFPTTSLAIEAAKFLLSSPTVPPPSSSLLFNATFLPTVEVAIFGNIFLSDFSSFLSSFSTPSDSLFFGSSQAQIFRQWVQQPSSPSANITWSQSMFASQTAQEGISMNNTFEQIWSVAGSLSTGPTNSSTVQDVVNALENAGLLSP